MSRSDPFADLAKTVRLLKEIGSHNEQFQALTSRLYFCEQMLEQADRLLREGPNGFGGKEEWMKARDEWLKKARR